MSYSIGALSRAWLRDGIMRHTFHLPVRETALTLQDVAIILGLQIHGPLVTSTCNFDMSSLCQELLGMIRPPTELR